MWRRVGIVTVVMDVPILVQILLDLGPCPQDATPLSSCMFYSPRIWSLLKARAKGLSSKVYGSRYIVVDVVSAAELERGGEENCEYFNNVLVKHLEWGVFFGRVEDLEVGAKISKGGQAMIFITSFKSFKDLNVEGLQLVVKVWREGVSWRDFVAL